MEWNAILFLGAFHGINPGMGWLFAVALGMQQGSVRGVWRALPPLALGHMAAVASVLAAAAIAQTIIPLGFMKVIVASALVAFGIYRLWRHRHPRFGGMRVGFRDLTIWSFLMASAHGAGLMLLPLVMAMSDDVMAAGGNHTHHLVAANSSSSWVGAVALTLHTVTYLLVLGLVAWVVYSKLGLSLLRTAWFNLDWLWAGALIATGLVVLLI